MGKRSRGDGEVEEDQLRHRFKRRKHCGQDFLSPLSDELLLRILSFLSLSSLARCEGVCLRFHALAGDGQLWKSLYYNRFVRPRAARIPGIREHTESTALLYSSRISRWLEEEKLVARGSGTDWKRQYKLRHNWSRGSCEVREIRISEPPMLPILVRLHEDVAVTVDSTKGLRAWLVKGEQRLLVTLPFSVISSKSDMKPTALALDTTHQESGLLNIIVGFEDGRFGVYAFHRSSNQLLCAHLHAPSSNGKISVIALAWPYVLSMTQGQLLSLYRFPTTKQSTFRTSLESPSLLSSLRSNTTWPPLTLSLRTSSSSLVASIAYALPTYLSGWSVGLQELRLTKDGTVIQSRLISAANQGFSPLPSQSSSISEPSLPSHTRGVSRLAYLTTRPTSLSYSHPYLLASHPDNTLTLYLVKSTESSLSISPGSRLWGHTSSVSGAHVGDRGKAVSVSLHGEEIRVWDLEGGINPSTSRKKLGPAEGSVRVTPGKTDQNPRKASSEGAVPFTRQSSGLQAMSTTKDWVGFDDERVIVLREQGIGTQALVVYDFS